LIAEDRRSRGGPPSYFDIVDEATVRAWTRGFAASEAIMNMPDLNHHQARILFELSNGKTLVVASSASAAYICGERDIENPQRGVKARIDDVNRLVETRCLTEKTRRKLTGIGEVTAYSVSPNGIEALFETSMKTVEE
jgi:hypothetical protein